MLEFYPQEVRTIYANSTCLMLRKCGWLRLHIMQIRDRRDNSIKTFDLAWFKLIHLLELPSFLFRCCQLYTSCTLNSSFFYAPWAAHTDMVWYGHWFCHFVAAKPPIFVVRNVVMSTNVFASISLSTSTALVSEWKRVSIQVFNHMYSYII